MSDLRLLSDQELIDASHRLRFGALRGSKHALAEARRYEIELQRRFGQVEQDAWSTATPEAPENERGPRIADEPVTLTAAAEQFILASADATIPLGEALRALLHHLRVILQMDLVFLAQFVDGNQVFRAVDLGEDAKAAIELGGAVPLETTLCQSVVDGHLPQLSRDTRAEPGMADRLIAPVMDIGAYLSTPIVLRDGHVYGTLCCINHGPRPSLDIEQLDALRYIAGIVAAVLEQRAD